MIRSLEIIFLVMILQFYQRLGAVAHSPSIQGYNSVVLKPNKHKGKSGRSSGGITLFYKKNFQTKIKVLKQSKHYIWLKLSSCIRNLSNEPIRFIYLHNVHPPS